MKTVTQKAKFRQAAINYAEKYGVTEGAKYLSLGKRYDGMLSLLVDKSRRPHSNSNQHTALAEYSRFRYVDAFEEYTGRGSATFLNHFVITAKLSAPTEKIINIFTPITIFIL